MDIKRGVGAGTAFDVLVKWTNIMDELWLCCDLL